MDFVHFAQTQNHLSSDISAANRRGAPLGTADEICATCIKLTSFFQNSCIFPRNMLIFQGKHNTGRLWFFLYARFLEMSTQIR